MKRRKAKRNPSGFFDKAESVADQKARLEREEKARKAKEQRAQIEERAGRRLEGKRGDIGQRDMFGGGDLFSINPKRKKKAKAAKASAKRAGKKAQAQASAAKGKTVTLKKTVTTRSVMRTNPAKGYKVKSIHWGRLASGTPALLGHVQEKGQKILVASTSGGGPATWFSVTPDQIKRAPMAKTNPRRRKHHKKKVQARRPARRIRRKAARQPSPKAANYVALRVGGKYRVFRVCNSKMTPAGNFSRKGLKAWAAKHGVKVR